MLGIHRSHGGIFRRGTSAVDVGNCQSLCLYPGIVL